MSYPTCDVCGAACIPRGCTTGYGVTPYDARLCFSCCGIQGRADMAVHGAVVGYCDGASALLVTDWSGNPLLRVIDATGPRRVGFGRRWYLRAVDRDGRIWSGSGPADSGAYVRMRRTRQTDPRGRRLILSRVTP